MAVDNGGAIRYYVHMGRRRSAMTPEVVNAIYEAIRLGLSYQRAADLAGISRSTLYSWIEKGKIAQSGQYKRFFDGLQKSKAEGEKNLVEIVQRAAEEDRQWTAAAWILERRHRDRWGRNVDITSGGEKIDVVISWDALSNDGENSND